MKKGFSIGLVVGMLIFLMVAVSPAVLGSTTSQWFGPYGTNAPGVFYRYVQDTWATDYNCVQFENRSTVKVKVDYVTENYPNTWYTLYLEAGQIQDPAAALVEGDRLKRVRVTATQ